MANKTQFLRASTLNRQLPVGTFIDEMKIAVVNGSAAIGDRIQLCTMTRNMRLFDAYLKHDASLGAGATAKLQRDRAGVFTDITGATTAGAAGVASSTTIGPVDLLEGDVVSVLIEGAGITAAANISADLQLQGK